MIPGKPDLSEWRNLGLCVDILSLRSEEVVLCWPWLWGRGTRELKGGCEDVLGMFFWKSWEALPNAKISMRSPFCSCQGAGSSWFLPHLEQLLLGLRRPRIFHRTKSVCFLLPTKGQRHSLLIQRCGSKVNASRAENRADEHNTEGWEGGWGAGAVEGVGQRCCTCSRYSFYTTWLQFLFIIPVFLILLRSHLIQEIYYPRSQWAFLL